MADKEKKTYTLLIHCNGGTQDIELPEGAVVEFAGDVGDWYFNDAGNYEAGGGPDA